MCVGVDITDSENTKRELELRLDTENFTFQCIAEMHRNQPADRMFDNLLGMIGKFLSADRVYIFTFNGNTMSNNYEWCASGIKPVIDAMQNIDTDIISRRIPEYMQRKSVIVKDINDLKNSDPFEYAALLGQDTHSIVTAPLFEKNELIGYIGADNPRSKKSRTRSCFSPP